MVSDLISSGSASSHMLYTGLLSLQLKMFPYLEEQILGGEVIHQADVVLIHHGQLATATAEVKAAH